MERADAPVLERVAPYGVGVLGFLFVAFVAGSGGGFRPVTWAWTALLSWWIALIAIVVKRRLPFGPLEVTMGGGLVAFACWFGISALWSQSVPSTLDTTVRAVAYAGLVVAALLVVRRRTVTHLIGGVTAGIGILALYGLATRLLPDKLGEFSSTATNYRLATPIGYWNGMGVFCSMGILLALGLATRAKRVPSRSRQARPCRCSHAPCTSPSAAAPGLRFSSDSPWHSRSTLAGCSLGLVRPPSAPSPGPRSCCCLGSHGVTAEVRRSPRRHMTATVSSPQCWPSRLCPR